MAKSTLGRIGRGFITPPDELPQPGETAKQVTSVTAILETSEPIIQKPTYTVKQKNSNSAKPQLGKTEIQQNRNPARRNVSAGEKVTLYLSAETVDQLEDAIHAVRKVTPRNERKPKKAEVVEAIVSRGLASIGSAGASEIVQEILEARRGGE